MRIIVQEFGVRMNGKVGKTGEMLADLTEAEIAENAKNALARKLENPYCDTAIICSENDIDRVNEIIDQSGVDRLRAGLVVRLPMSLEILDKCPCGGEYEWSKTCGANVCTQCDNHLKLARCFCGWSADGGDGRAELEEMGETIEPEE